MALMLGSLYDALTSANVPKEKALKAAEEVAGYENRLASIDQRIAKVEGELSLLKWMVGVNVAATLAILMRVFFP